MSPFLLAAALAVLPATGCGSDRLHVGGRVARNDGSPVVGARVYFRSPETGQAATAYTDQEGRYALGTSEVGEGVLPGEYYVLVSEDRGPRTKLRPRTVHAKYESPDTSPLKFTVEPGGETTYDIVLDPPQ
jgi:hypothetical protein